MPRLPAGVGEAESRLKDATSQLAAAVKDIEDDHQETPWQERKDDLELLKEQVIDIRQQLALLRLETAAEPTSNP